MKNASRRKFLVGYGSLLASTAALGPFNAYASKQHHHGGSAEGIVVDSTLENRCATCQFWGGMRKLSQDKSQVIAQSMGWCNNPDSGNYQKLTEADHHMMKPDIWQKWSAIN
jgi:hypothetical protein